MGKRMNRGAFVLIIVLPLLSLMAILGATFVALAHLELQVSTGYIDKVRARALAISGIDFAIGQLRFQAMQRAWDRPDDAWVFRNDAGTGVGHGTPLFYRPAADPAANPSFLNPVPFVHSGPTLAGAYVNGGDYFLLKVTDCHSKLNLNSPHMTNGAQPNFDAMMDTLIAEIRVTVPLGPTLPAGLNGAAIRAKRTALGGRFSSVQELMGVGGLNEETLDIFADFVSASGWVDPNVIEPNPAASFPPGDAGAIVSRTRATDPTYPGRFPVNLNTAPKAVLVAVLTGLAGSRLRPTTYGQTVLGEPSVTMAREAIAPLSVGIARTIADALIAQRDATPFNNWAQFETFVLGIGGITRPQALLVCANANPNTRSAKFNPDNGAAYRHPGSYSTGLGDPDYSVDKLDLNPGTTEFCFMSMGHFDIESIGRVIGSGPGNPIVGEARITTSLRIFDVMRHTTQRHFSQERLAAQANPPVFSYPNALWDDPSASAGVIGTGGTPLDGYLALSPEWEGNPGGVTWFINNRRSMNLIDGSVPGGYLAPNHVTATGPASRMPIKQEGRGDGGPPPGWALGAYPYGTGTTATATTDLWQGSDLANDGILSWSRGNTAIAGETLLYDPTRVLGSLPGSPPPTSGAVEFWVKPASTHGSNEVYVAIVTPTEADPDGAGPGLPRQGLAWRLERYGTRLYSVRFYWFTTPPILPSDRCPYPDTDDHDGRAASDCEGYTYYEQWQDISSWRAGEWHKIRHVFPHPTGSVADHGLVTHQTYVDGVAMGNDFGWFRDKDHPNTVNEQTQENRSIVADPPFVGSTINYTITVTTITNQSNLMNLKTMDAAPRLCVGGFLYNKGADDLFRIDNLTATSNRFSNTTIDEVRYFRDNAGSGSDNRYSAGGGIYEGRIAAVPAGSMLGTLSYTAYYPRAWNGIATHGNGALVTASYATSANPAWVSGGASGTGEGVELYAGDVPKRSSGGGMDFHYQLNFQPQGTPTVLTPVVDDVTLTVLRVQILSWTEPAVN